MKAIAPILLVILAGCETLGSDQTIIPTRKLEIPEYVRIPCKKVGLPEREATEVEIVEYISRQLDEIDDCDKKRQISVDLLDSLNQKPLQTQELNDGSN